MGLAALRVKEPASVAGCLTMGEESMPPINESLNVMVCELPCIAEPPLPSNTIEPGSAPGCWAGDMAVGGAATSSPPVVPCVEKD